MAAALATVTAAAGVVVVAAAPVDATVVRPFTKNYDEKVYGDFVQTGNGSMRCPDPTDPVDPFGEARSNCAGAQARTYTAATGINDDYYMRWADTDSLIPTWNSSSGSVSIPVGAKIDFARLNWAGNTGTVRGTDGTINEDPGCSTRQYLADAGNANTPSGTPESTQVWVTAGSSSITVPPQTISRDALANVGDAQAQYYTAYADVTSFMQGNLSGGSNTISIGNVWTPEGFGCFSGWSLVVVWYFDGPNPSATTAHQVSIYDGHVRQSSSDSATTVNLSGFRAASSSARVGVTTYEGDFNLTGDTFSVNSTAVTEPYSGGTTSNFFVSNADSAVSPSVANNMSVDAKTFTTTLIPAGTTTASLSFATTSDTYLAQNIVVSIPVPDLYISKTLTSAGPFKSGDTVGYSISVTATGGDATAVSVSDPNATNCSKTIGSLLSGNPNTYTCTGTAQANSFTNTATASGLSAYSDEISSDGSVDVTVIHPSLAITKTPDKANYATGETITFTITVHNDGDSPLTAVSVSDPSLPACNKNIGALGTGGSNNYTCTATAPIVGDSNTATVTGTDQTNATVTKSVTTSAPTVGTISGRVFSDRNNNGNFDVGTNDTGISGVSVVLTGTKTNGGATVNIPTTTASDGTYSFTAVEAGTYQVTETTPSAYDDGIDTAGVNATNGPDDIINVTLTAGQSSTGNNFAERATSSLVGYIYVDTNNNGVKDIGENGLVEEQVTLTGTDSDSHTYNVAAYTDGSGKFTVPALRPGTYTLTKTQPSGYLDGKETVGNATGTLSPPYAISTITLAARTTGSGYLFGNYLATGISGTVVDDGNNPIQGVSIALSGQSSGTTTTNASGVFSFPNLAPGTYTLTETQPPAYGDGPESSGSPAGNISVNDVISGINLLSGVPGTGYKFAETRGSVSGFVFDDYNNNGIKDAGEPGIAAALALTGTATGGGAVTQNVTSNASTGAYSFTNLLGGTYQIVETTPVTRLDGKDTVGNSSGTHSSTDTISGIVLAGGFAATGYTFGELVPSSLAGTVTNNSVTPGPLKNITITLTGTDDLTNPVNLTTTTANDGTYSFTNLRPGEYSLVETQPTGYADGSATPGDEGGTPVTPNVITGIGLDPNKTSVGYDFTDNLNSLSGVVFQDNSKDGIKQVGEPGIPDVVLHLTGTDVNSNTVNVTATTKANGTYLFPDLVAGNYVLDEDQPDTYNDGIDTPGTAGGTTSGDDTIIGIVLPTGEPATGYTFAELPDRVSGTVWLDVDGDGLIGQTETTFLPNVTVDLENSGGTVITTTTTDNSGHYAFEDLPLGSYIVVEHQPDGYGSSTPNSVPITLVQLNPTTISGKVVNFGEQLGQIGDFVWSDTNGNGVQDSGEPGVSGLTVTLYNESGGVVTTTTTNGDGNYHFLNLMSGTYSVGVTLPTGKVFTKPYVTGDDKNSDINWVTGKTAALAIVPGIDGKIPQLTNVDAGLVNKLTDLSVGVVTPTPSANVGNTVIFTATVKNVGTVPVVGAKTTITVPNGLKITSAGGTAVAAASQSDFAVEGDAAAAAATPWTCTISGQTATCTTDATIVPGQELGAVTVNTTALTTVTDTTATAAVALADGSPDDNSANDNAVAQVAVTVPTTSDTSGTTLVNTGADVKWPFFGGLILLLVGCVTVFVTRRKRRGNE
ncbi:SdrD B-like domain-containing protein [Actinokineospora inagensis]|uniref:SdrD B-like domain-containing protein n=1 Tax=Actinokineospora inagensis TaxID=103730 RepID=UPI000425FF39|nr:SdrD B-like domain-containing protein [Actinokineospora inagensis]